MLSFDYYYDVRRYLDYRKSDIVICIDRQIGAYVMSVISIKYRLIIRIINIANELSYHVDVSFSLETCKQRDARTNFPQNL